MSIGTSHGSEDPFLCSICLNVFTDPVCTPCGHNFCKSCLDRSWEGDTICQCPVCKEIFLMKPELQVNSLISDLAEEFRRSSRNKMQNASNPEERVRCSRTGWMLHIPFLLVMSLCVYSQAGQIKDRLREIDAEMDRKIQQIQLKTKDSAAKMQLDFIFTFIDRQKVKEEQVEGLMRELEELVIQVTDAFLMETLPMKKKEKISQVLTRLALSRARRYRADVTFDRDTAHRWLKVSDDGREVHFNDTLITHPDSPKRFSLRYAVLGQPGFSSGRFYFEVLVRGKTDWTLGVVTESVDRMENNSPSPQNGYWTIRLRNNHTYKGFGEDDVVLALHSRPEKIGVFVDYEERLVSFHDADSAALIYSYTSCFFAKKLHPYFSPSTDKAGRNSAPLVIIFP